MLALAAIAAVSLAGCLGQECPSDEAVNGSTDSLVTADTLCTCDETSVGEPCGWSDLGICVEQPQEMGAPSVFVCACADPLSRDCPAQLACQ
jgi:hypothetical protein